VGLREQKKQEMRAAIAASALSLFRSVGFEHTRVRDVTTALRISEATFFNYFPTKQAVLDAIASDLVQRSLAELRDAVALDAPFADRLDRIIGHFGADFGDDRELLRLLVRHTRLLDGRQAEGPYPEHRQLVRELFADGQRRGEVDTGISAAQLAEIYEATVVATVEGWLYDDNDDGRLSDRMDRAVRLLLRGCAPPT
jgi:AcrR family transcriptional regulator